MNLKVIALQVLDWYTANKRELPWRKTQNPYYIWLSEVIMQQTRIAQGTAYYLRFIDAYPKVEDLANAPIDEVLKLWEGLGYYSRARNLHAAANQITHMYNGRFPENDDELLKIKGIGPYTAAAIASICFGKKSPVIDGNVFRVLSRLLGIYTPINSHAAKAEFTSIAQKIINYSHHAGNFNQGMMELGATVCTPKKAQCEVCPLQIHCVAFRDNIVYELPVKHPKKPVRHRFFNFLICATKKGVAIEKRPAGDIWQGLYQFPLIETSENIALLNDKTILFGKQNSEAAPLHSCKHLLTHQTLHINFWVGDAEILPNDNQLQFITLGKISDFAFPVPLKNFIESKLLHLRPEIFFTKS